MIKEKTGWQIIKGDLKLIPIWSYFCKYILDDVLPFAIKALIVYYLIKKSRGW